jgi:hypothetical protein
VKPIGQILLAAFFTMALIQSAQSEPEEQVSWREQYAYSVGMAVGRITIPFTLPPGYTSMTNRLS